MDTTTIRVGLETRDRINILAAELGLKTVEATINYLADFHWKAMCVEDWDRFREEDPEGYREYQAEARHWVNATVADGLTDEPPYRSNDPDWLAVGGQSVEETKVA